MKKIKVTALIVFTVLIFSSLLNAQRSSNGNANIAAKVISGISITPQNYDAISNDIYVQGVNLPPSNASIVTWTISGEPNMPINISYSWKATEDEGDGHGVSLTLLSKFSQFLGGYPYAIMTGINSAPVQQGTYSTPVSLNTAGKLYIFLKLTGVTVDSHASLGNHFFTQSIAVNYYF